MIHFNYFLQKKLIDIRILSIGNFVKVYIYGVKGTIHLFLLHALLNKKMLDINVRNRLYFRYTQDKIFNTIIYWNCESRLRPARAQQYASNPPSI